jgi:hypothetical protein
MTKKLLLLASILGSIWACEKLVSSDEPIPTSPVFALASVGDSIQLTGIPSQLSVGQSVVANAVLWRGDKTQPQAKFVWTAAPGDILTTTVVQPKGTQATILGKAEGSAYVIVTVNTVRDSILVHVGSIAPPPPPPPPPPVDTATVAELPRVFMNTTYPVRTGVIRSVPSGGDLQAAMNAANPGDVIELAQGATYVGNFVWPAKACTAYTVIRTTGADSDFPADGSRMTPSYAPKLAKIITPNVSAAITAGNRACKLRLSRVEITGTPQDAINHDGVNYNFGLVRIGDGDATTIADMATDIVLDRVYLHGSSVLSVQHGILLNGAANAVIDSWVSDIHMPGVETHAVGGWSGVGPFKIMNDYLEAASINFLYGGAPSQVPGVHPGDFEIRHNHFYKPTTYFSKGFAVKNLLEFKHGVRILIEDNIFENSWADAQAGYALILQSGGDSPPPGGLAFTGDITIRNNIVRNAPYGINLPANPYGSSIPMTRIAVENNLFENIGPFGPVDSDSRGFQLLDNLSYVRVVHNTLIRFGDGISFSVGREVGVPEASNIVITDNIAGLNTPYGAVFASGYVGTSALTSWAGSSYRFDHNVFWNSNIAEPTDPRAPAGNFWPTTQADVGFASDWSLLSTSPYKGKATDGKDPGADITIIKTRTNNVIINP